MREAYDGDRLQLGADDCEEAIVKWLKGLSEHSGGSQALLFALSEQVRLGRWRKPIDAATAAIVFAE